jgi:MFS family permease
MLGTGFALSIVADIVLAAASNIWIVMIGVALWGLHLGMTQGLLSALVADEAPENLRATAFGMFNFATGMALLLASLMAGFLWEQIGPSATFIAGAAFTGLGLSALYITHRANPVV